MRGDEELPIIRAFYDLTVWLIPKIAKFPRDHRFVLGERIERQLWIGHACHADTWQLRADLFSRTIFLGPAADESRPSGRLLEQQAEQHPVCQPQQERSGQPQQQQRFSAGQHCPPPF